MFCCVFFFFKQKTAYEMRISDWSSDVCSSDLPARRSDVSPITKSTDSTSLRSPSSELPEITRAPVRFTELPPIVMLYGTYQSLEPRRRRPELAEVTLRS